jgi:DNA-binding FadR family transcriptional regulator
MRAAGAFLRFHLAVARASKIELLADLYESIVAVLTRARRESHEVGAQPRRCVTASDDVEVDVADEHLGGALGRGLGRQELHGCCFRLLAG